jgi:cell division transport system ATP-binding protein
LHTVSFFFGRAVAALSKSIARWPRVYHKARQRANVRIKSVVTSHALIRFENVGVRYGVGQEILRDINFYLQPGSFHFLTGASGAGKTTLLRLLFMSLRPTRGLVYLFGRNIAKNTPAQRADLRRRIGVVFQDFRLLDHLTTWENVALPLRVLGKKQSDYREDVTELLKWVGLGDRMHAFPEVLSGGEKQRAAIARAVIGKPELLLADEPTGNVDPQMARRLLRLFIELNRLGTSIIIATHDYQLMSQFPAPRLQLENGRLEIQE